MPIVSTTTLEKIYLIYLVSCSRTRKRPVILMGRIRRARGSETVIGVTTVFYTWQSLWWWFVNISERLNSTEFTARLSEVTTVAWGERMSMPSKKRKMHSAHWFLWLLTEYEIARRHLADHLEKEPEELGAIRPEQICVAENHFVITNINCQLCNQEIIV